MDHGQLDAVIHRKEMRETVSSIVKLHTRRRSQHGENTYLLKNQLFN